MHMKVKKYNYLTGTHLSLLQRDVGRAAQGHQFPGTRLGKPVRSGMGERGQLS